MTISVDALVDAAVSDTGLDDFGPWAWRDGLEVIVEAADNEGELNSIGRMILAAWVGERLRNRLRVVDWHRAGPDTGSVTRPIVVAGMLRTGTTILSELLAQDPANRPLWKWEALDSVPPPAPGYLDPSGRPDPRIEKWRRIMEATYEAVPELKAVHWEPGDGPTECVALLGQAFRSQDWLGLFRIPSYVDWYLGCDMAPAYDYHRASLQLLGSEAGGRWSLKAPGHLLALDALRATYPDACIIVCHRDPVRTVASAASLSLNSKPGTVSRHTDQVGYFGPLWLEMQATMTDRLVEHRDRCGDDGFYDLRYDRFVADPVAEITRAYAHFGDELSPEAAAAMATFLAAHQQGRHGSHRYGPAHVGLTDTLVRDRFAGYTERFGIVAE